MIETRPHETGRHHPETDAARRAPARWRFVERALSLTIGGAALSGAVWLGVTGPLVSPVAATGAAVAAPTTTGGTTGGAAASGTGQAVVTVPVVPDRGRGGGDDQAGRGRGSRRGSGGRR